MGYHVFEERLESSWHVYDRRELRTMSAKERNAVWVDRLKSYLKWPVWAAYFVTWLCSSFAMGNGAQVAGFDEASETSAHPFSNVICFLAIMAAHDVSFSSAHAICHLPGFYEY